MKKILTIGLAVLLSVFLGGMMSGASPLYAFSGEGFNEPGAITADLDSPAPGIAYHETLADENSYALNSEEVKEPSINQDFVSPTATPGIAYDKTLANCPAYALNSEMFSGPVVSSESGGALQGTDDAITLVAMLCQ